MTIEKKDASISNTGSDDDFPGSFEVILSAPTLDRDGDTLKPDEWKQPLPEHITFDMDHGMSVATTVGSGTPRIDAESGALLVSGTYSSLPRAQEVRTLVNEGHIRTTSVAFMSTKATKDGKGAVTRELLNGAFVAIPSNREALVLSSKSLDVKEGRRNSDKDAEKIQAVHDNAVALGASCSDSEDDKAARASGTKSIIGSLEAVQDRAREALALAYGQRYGYLRGTLTDALVFDLYDAFTYDVVTYRQTYEDDGTQITLTGSPEPVGVAEVVTSPADAAPEGKSADSADSAAPAVKAAAPETPETPDDTDDELHMRALALAIECVALAEGE